MDIRIPQDSVLHSFMNDILHFKAQRGTSRGEGPQHIHDYFQIWYVLKGEFTHSVNGKEYRQHAGELLIVPPYISHAINTSDASEDLEFAFVDLADNFLNLFPEGKEKDNLFYYAFLRPLEYNAVEFSPFIAFTGDEARQIEALYIGMVEEYNKCAEMSPAYIRADLIRLFSLISKKYSSMIKAENREEQYNQYKEAILRAIQYIDVHCCEAITVHDVCAVAHMSTSSFSYVFKQFTGKTLIEYVNSRRIRMAAKLLETTDMSVSEVCWKCGYADPTYFGRVFKRQMGMRPKQYQMQHHDEKK